MDELINLVPSIACESDARLLYMYIINFKYINVMAKNVINEKGFKIIAMSPKECEQIDFGVCYLIKGKHCWELICDSCNKLLNEDDEVYYISVLNRVFCKDCLIDWYEKATYYPEDKHYEIRKYDAISGSIQINESINIKDL